MPPLRNTGDLSGLPVGAGPRPARGRTLCAPTAENGPRALVRRRQAQKRKRTSYNFLPAQAPSGAGRNRAQALLILRAGRILPAPRDNPRKRGPGKGEYERDRGKANMSAKRSSEPSPGAFWFLCRHGQRNSPPAGGEIFPCEERNCSIIAPSSVTASPCHLPPRGKAFKGSPLIRLA